MSSRLSELKLLKAECQLWFARYLRTQNSKGIFELIFPTQIPFSPAGRGCRALEGGDSPHLFMPGTGTVGLNRGLWQGN